MSRDCAEPWMPRLRLRAPLDGGDEPARKKVADESSRTSETGWGRPLPRVQGEHLPRATRTQAPLLQDGRRPRVQAAGVAPPRAQTFLRTPEAGLVPPPRHQVPPRAPRGQAAAHAQAPPRARPETAVTLQAPGLAGPRMLAADRRLDAPAVRDIALVSVTTASTRAMAPVLPGALAVQDAAAAPRRAGDTQVAPIALRDQPREVAAGGELARRPTRAAVIFPRTPEVDAAESALAKALLAIITGERKTMCIEEVKDALMSGYGLAPGSFSVHRHKPENFLIFFASIESRNRVLDDEYLQSPRCRLFCCGRGRGGFGLPPAGSAYTRRLRSRVSRRTRGVWRPRSPSWRRRWTRCWQRARCRWFAGCRAAYAHVRCDGGGGVA